MSPEEYNISNCEYYSIIKTIKKENTIQLLCKKLLNIR